MPGYHTIESGACLGEIGWRQFMSIRRKIAKKTFLEIFKGLFILCVTIFIGRLHSGLAVSRVSATANT